LNFQFRSQKSEYLKEKCILSSSSPLLARQSSKRSERERKEDKEEAASAAAEAMILYFSIMGTILSANINVQTII
jgi:hypothetical protein